MYYRLYRLLVSLGLVAYVLALTPAAHGGAKLIASNTQVTDAGLVRLANAEAPDVAALDTTIYTVWTDDRNYAPTAFGLNDVWLARSTDGGITWEPNRRVSSIPGSLSNQDPRVAVAADGTVWSAPRVVGSSGTELTIGQFDLAVDSGGQVVMGWSQRGSVGPASDLILATSIDRGEHFSAVQVEDRDGTSVSTQADVALTAAGGGDPAYALLAWQDNRNVQRRPAGLPGYRLL
jgi:hypothetical protein